MQRTGAAICNQLENQVASHACQETFFTINFSSQDSLLQHGGRLAEAAGRRAPL
jgi:hypothetical protein